MRHDFKYLTTPLNHQVEYFERTRELPAFACFWEQGLGKSKALIDQAAWLYSQGLIDGLLVIAPNGVHRNWTDDELPKHLHPQTRWSAYCYQSSTGTTQRAKREVQQLLDHKGLAVLVVSYDALMTEQGAKTVKAFLTKRHCLYAADESARIKTPTAKRTIRVLASSKYAPYRRIMSGTPVGNGPFDVFTQMKFLGENFWAEHFASYAEFKTTFGVFQEVRTSGGQRFQLLVKYRQLPWLYSLLKEHSSRLLKTDVLDLPDKIYTKRYYQPSSKQLAMYREIEQTGLVNFQDSLHDATLAIVRQMRMYQVLCGYLPTDVENPKESLELIDQDNPRLKCLFDALEDCPGQTIVWAKWTKDIDLILEEAARRKIIAVRYDGQVGDDERQGNLKRFKDDATVTLFVAKQSTAGEGLTIVNAKTSIYYTNDWSLSARLQSEDRNHRIGQDTSPTYIDIVAHDTLDMKIVEALQRKLDVACTILGDTAPAWIGDAVRQADSLVQPHEYDLDGYAEFMRAQG
jgi:hypothetical protein